MPYRASDLDALLQEGEDARHGVRVFKAFFDREALPRDLGGELAVMGTTETLTFATAHAPELRKGEEVTVAGEHRLVREVRLVGDGAISIAFLERP